MSDPTPSLHSGFADDWSYLESATLKKKIQDGYITLGLIRPNVHLSVNFASDHINAANKLEASIDTLRPTRRFSITFDGIAIESLYDGVKQSQMSRPPEFDPSAENRWTEFTNLMTSGPSRVLLLQSTTKNAVDLWRKQIGHWDIERHRDVSTLRGRYGIHNHNNLFHGSDSPQNAMHEISIVFACAKRIGLLSKH